MTERITDERLRELLHWCDPDNRDCRQPQPDKAWEGLTDALRELAELREQVRWIPVTERLPELTKEQRKPNSFGVPVLIAPWYGGDGISPTPFAYFGTRVYDTPCFYIYGRQVFPDYWREIGPLPTGEQP